MNQSVQSIKQQAFQALRWTVTLRFIGQAISWLFTIIIIRLLSPQDYGLLAMANSFFNFIVMLSTSGLGDGLIYTRQHNERQIRQILGLLIVVNLTLFIVTVSLAPVVARYYKQLQVKEILQVLALAFLMLPWIILLDALLTKNIDFKKKTIIEFAGICVSGLTSFYLAWSGFGVWSLVIAQLGNLFVQATTLMLVCPLPGKPLFNFSGIESIIKFGSVVTLTSIVWSIYVNIDIMIAGRYMDSVSIGLYATAFSLATMPMIKITPIITQIAFPVFSRIKDSHEQLTWYFRRSLRLASIIAFPIFIGLASVAPEFVPVILGDRWLEVTYPMMILAFSVPLRFVMNLFSPVIKALGRPEVTLSNAVYTLIILVVSCLIGVQWGLHGLAWSWMIGTPFAFAITLIQASRVIRISIFELMSDILPALLASVAMFLILRTMAGLADLALDKLTLMVMLIVLGVVVYIIMLSLFFPTCYREMITLWQDRHHG